MLLRRVRSEASAGKVGELAQSIVLSHTNVGLILIVKAELVRKTRCLLHVIVVVAELAQIVLKQGRVQKLSVTEAEDHLLGLLEYAAINPSFHPLLLLL